jgi:hypothetical protein
MPCAKAIISGWGIGVNGGVVYFVCSVAEDQGLEFLVEFALGEESLRGVWDECPVWDRSESG